MKNYGLYPVTAVIILVIVIITIFLFTLGKSPETTHAMLVTTVSNNTTYTIAFTSIVPQNSPNTNVTAVLQNPGNITASQFDAYPSCIPNNVSYNQFIGSGFTCGVGQRIGYFIIRSINLNETVSFYYYAIQPAQTYGETWTPQSLEKSSGQSIYDQCGVNITLNALNYTRSKFNISIKKGTTSCPT